MVQLRCRLATRWQYSCAGTELINPIPFQWDEQDWTLSHGSTSLIFQDRQIHVQLLFTWNPTL